MKTTQPNPPLYLIEDDDALRLELLGDEPRHLGVEDVLVVIDENVGVVDHVSRQKVGAPSFLPPEGFEVVQRVDPVRDDGVGARAVVLLVVLAQLRVGAAPVCFGCRVN